MRLFRLVLPLTRLPSLVPLIVLVVLYRWLTRFDGVLIWGKVVNGVIGWDRWYFCINCCWLWSFSFNCSRLCFINDEADVDDVIIKVEDELLGWSHSWCTASSGVIRFFGSHLKADKIISKCLMSTSASTHSKHLLTKSMKSVSLHLNAWESVFDPGLRLRPFEFVTQRGTPRESEIG